MERLGRPKDDVTERQVLFLLSLAILVLVSIDTRLHYLKTLLGEWRRSYLMEI